MTDLSALESDLIARINGATDPAALEAIRIEALGKTGSISGLLKTLGSMTPDERKTEGPKINGLRDRVQSTLTSRKDALEARALDEKLSAERLDLTLPAPPRRKGSVHPTMQVMDEMIAIFADMGFAVAEGPDIEDDFHNFTALNFPPKHPARDMHDTFFFAPDANGDRKLLRTHTSPVQIRVMQQTNEAPPASWISAAQKPPIRVIVPGRTYRIDSDATHTPMFHQMEGLVIDKAIHMGHLKWTLETFIARFFEVEGVTARFRPHHFPFTEPSAEMDIGCDRSGGELKIGQGSDWLEILGCGMVHPNVLRHCGIDPDEYQGFAFGLGVDRLAMLKYGIPDLRDMFASDTRWLDQLWLRRLFRAEPGVRALVMAWWSDLPRDRFGDSAQMNSDLAALVVCGRKRATCGALSSYTPEMTPTPGSRWVIEDGSGAPVCVIETMTTEVRRFDEVDAAFAQEEGEGDLSLAWWRETHRSFFIREGSFAPDMQVLCEHFRLVEVIAPETAQ